jgi:hypothetical protein
VIARSILVLTVVTTDVGIEVGIVVCSAKLALLRGRPTRAVRMMEGAAAVGEAHCSIGLARCSRVVRVVRVKPLSLALYRIILINVFFLSFFSFSLKTTYTSFFYYTRWVVIDRIKGVEQNRKLLPNLESSH